MEYKDELEKIAKKLLEKEILFQSDLEELIGKRPFEKETSYEAFMNREEEQKKEEKVEEGKTEEDVVDTKEETEERKLEPSKRKEEEQGEEETHCCKHSQHIHRRQADSSHG